MEVGGSWESRSRRHEHTFISGYCEEVSDGFEMSAQRDFLAAVGE